LEKGRLNEKRNKRNVKVKEDERKQERAIHKGINQ
jgi:hypothetical protein